ncbi:hypothetical protein QC762_0063250 [Podospora pseudocomata]|uniref:Uncharacterized protein n=1 Tax=Podospora pseudocomata TaxID=2093779 RepID=A0ABR0GEK4_9PEZI|nr:hypothetical protein QC762_0063250 [Podospora pseudocomata]
MTPYTSGQGRDLSPAPAPGAHLRPESKPTDGNEKKPDPNLRPRPDEKTAKEIERFIKLHYVRSRPYDKCMDIFYGLDKPSNMKPSTHWSTLSFNLSGYDNWTVSEEEFKIFLGKLKFSDVLQYIGIPKVPLIHRKAAVSREPRGSAIGRNDLLFVSDCLRDKGVKSILVVMVDDEPTVSDNSEASHT